MQFIKQYSEKNFASITHQTKFIRNTIREITIKLRITVTTLPTVWFKRSLRREESGRIGKQEVEVKHLAASDTGNADYAQLQA